MHTDLKIFIEQLRDGRKENIELTVPSDFLDLNDKDLVAAGPVAIQGEAYLAGGSLVLHLDCRTEVKMPCAICNKAMTLPLHAKEIYFLQPESELAEAIFDYSRVVREELLLLAPHFAECGGNCPERSQIDPFLKKETSKPEDGQSKQYPFANL